MWAQRSLRPLRSQLHRTVRFSRKYNGNQYQGPHTTYFQQPPEPPKARRSYFRSILISCTFIALGAFGHAYLFDVSDLGLIVSEDVADAGEDLSVAMAAAAQDTAARQVPMMDMTTAQEFLELRATHSVTAKAVAHSCQLPSNLPCEDAVHSGVYELFHDALKDWAVWSVFDGHAGPRTAQLLKEFLPVIVGGKLYEDKCLDRSYVPNDYQIIRTIKNAFTELDHDILLEASQRVQSGEGDLAHGIHITAAALSGSCALLALFDPARSILRVANTGDSRAVLGRWDAKAGKYVAQPMSIDQTGFNQSEVERLDREHPNEASSVDPKTGRVHGIMISRAFGDARWKWPNELSKMVQEKFFGPPPRPDGMIKTPPYLTAEPEVMETEVQTGERPDFLIMASDGLWDNMSSEDAVTCVQMWLDKNRPDKFIEEKQTFMQSLSEIFSSRKDPSQQLKRRQNILVDDQDPNMDEETYYDESERTMKWRVSPKHFLVEDEHCGVHLIKNALGGKRRNLFRGVMSIQPPLSRNVRDDISVHVIFFGVDAREVLKNGV